MGGRERGIDRIILANDTGRSRIRNRSECHLKPEISIKAASNILQFILVSASISAATYN